MVCCHNLCHCRCCSDHYRNLCDHKLPSYPSDNSLHQRFKCSFGQVKLDYNQVGILDLQVSIVITAKNENIKNHVRFNQLELTLALHELQIAKLVNKPFDVKKNDSLEFFYLVKSEQIHLRSVYRDYVQSLLMKNIVSSELKGTTTTKWKVCVIDSVKITLHMNCNLHFIYLNESLNNESHCSFKSS